ncbi:putative transporter [Tolypocladium ophioglossoides CBS 100239]|uniref:Putative transporter n=1 Tax=Tolypocladium ophioglossoides (strain CBS 100239) TaxID=1163406 RepID=A0A0L0NFS3_TOLOC|nr:putative transporter [Tolypocladium ophioglossoides CBS 100239]
MSVEAGKMSATDKGIVDNSSNSEVDNFADPDAGLTEEEKLAAERKLLWKLDLRLIPWLSLLYLMCFLDRTNIGNAKIAKLEKDLHIDPQSKKYNATLTIFFVAYAVFEALCNFLLKKLRPSIFIPTIMVLWGACMLGMGFVKKWSGLMAGRWFLGVCEAGLFPGINYYLSCWYRRDEFGVRAAIFFSAAAVSGSFGGLLAAAIQKMDGLQGLAGWSWIFIIEGLLTIIIGLVSFFMVHDFPDEAKFLSKDDRARVLLRLKRDGQHSAEHEDFKIAYFWAALKDWKTYAGMLIYMGPLMPLYAFSIFLPSIIQSMSFTDKSQIIKNQLLSVPPYAVAAILTIVVGFLSDKLKRRGVFNMGCAIVGAVGFIMLMATTNPAVQYVGTFLGACGIYPSISLTIAWITNNVEGVYKRGIVLGFVIGWGNLNGVVSSNIYFDPPRYFAGHGTVAAYLLVCMFCGSLLMQTLLGIENNKRRNGERDHWIEGKTEAEINALGDKRPDFIYTL